VFERLLKWLRKPHDQPTTPARPDLTPEEEEARRRQTSDEPLESGVERSADSAEGAD
jgi:hypothetical protein